MKRLLSQAMLALLGLVAVNCGGTNDSGGDSSSRTIQQAIVATDSAGVQHHGLMVTTDSLPRASSLSERVVPILAEESASSVADFDARVRTVVQNLQKQADETGEVGTAFVFEEPSIVGVQFSLGQDRALPGDPLEGVHPALSESSYPFSMTVTPSNPHMWALSSNIYCSAGATALSTQVICASGSGALVQLIRSGTVAGQGAAACPPYGWGTFVSNTPFGIYNVQMTLNSGSFVYTTGYFNCFF
jgi:hypothetical protein